MMSTINVSGEATVVDEQPHQRLQIADFAWYY
jgi:hypothetical protein